MNVFLLDEDPALCAQYTCDKHISIGILNTGYILSRVMRNRGIVYGFNVSDNRRTHPFVKWAESRDGNFLWLQQLGVELCKEFSYRYSSNGSHSHSSEHIIRDTYLEEEKRNIRWKKEKCEVDIDNAPQCIPGYLKNGSTIKSYRDYYLIKKSHMLQYTKRNVPNWILDLGMGEHR